MDPLAPYFLGAFAENNDFFEKTVIELVRDHVFWRRNFHPEDLPPIGTADQYSPEYLEGMARTRHELHQLTAALKRSVPFFHPRYLGHMVSDLLLPGLIAQLVTTLYNPNNVVEDAAPVTVQLELEVGRQLATMLGFSIDPAKVPCALGHLTSGGTIANDQALFLARAVRLLPLAMRDALDSLGRRPETVSALLDGDDWSHLNLSTRDILDLADTFHRDPELARALALTRVEHVGLGSFCAKHPLVANLTVIAPGTAHYSWKKALRLLGLGAANLIDLPTRQARADSVALEALLQTFARERRPVLMVMGVYGTTEFGTLDPLHELAALRGRAVDFWLHVDAAWGGYLPSVFRDAKGQLRPREDLRAEFAHFPSQRVYDTTAALALADSVTVDPHKQGFVPFGVGCFVAKDRRVFDLVLTDAAYVFHGDQRDQQRYRAPGRFSLEGSRPGAAAAACSVNHRVLPLDAAHFGRLIARSVHTCETLFDALPAFAARLASVAKLATPFDPDCNLLVFAVNPVGNRSLKAANAFGQRVMDAMSVTPGRPVQLREFFGSCTTVSLEHLSADSAELFRALGITEVDDDGVFLLRHTLMNPWLLSHPTDGDGSYLDAYLAFLERTVHELVTVVR
jgi:glutamate/tyrosine decarboxylase-like PLP-dependent enzyme